MNPQLRSLLARVSLVGGVGLGVALMARSAPRDQTLAITLESQQVSHVEAVVTKQGDSEPTAGFSQDFAGRSPRVVRHTFAAPDDTYIVVVTLRAVSHSEGSGDEGPIPSETSFERRVSLMGGEVILSPE